MNHYEALAEEKKLIQYTPKLSKRLSSFSAYLFVIPGILFLLFFMIFPIVYNLLISFQNVSIMNLSGEHAFVGLKNYVKVVKDPLFGISLKHSIIFTVLSIGFQFGIGFALALFFNLKFPGRNIMRSMMLLAWMMPVVITSTLFVWMLSGDYGILNYFLHLFGLIDKPHFWLSEPSTALYGTILANIWIGIPFNMIILLSGLQALPEHLYEAAKIDGASRVRQFVHITMPLMKPTILILLMLGIIYTFKVFDLIFVMTGGGPVNTSTVLPFYGYQLAFTTFEFSDGAAVSTIMFAILIAIAVIYLRMMRKEETH